VPTGASGTPSIEIIALHDLESPVLRKVDGLWQAWRGSARMPPRERLSFRELGGAAKHVSLARVLDGGADYEFRIVGDAHVQALGSSPLYRRLSDVRSGTAERPRLGFPLADRLGCARYALRLVRDLLFPARSRRRPCRSYPECGGLRAASATLAREKKGAPCEAPILLPRPAGQAVKGGGGGP